MTQILRALDVLGETISGETVTHAEVVLTRFNTIGIEYHTRWSSGGGDPFKTEDEAEAALRAKFDSYVAPRDKTQIAALAAIDKWGDFCSSFDDLTELASLRRNLYRDERKRVDFLIAQTETRAQKQYEAVLAYVPAGDSEISDAEVAASIRLLTGRDDDHAELANKAGWSASHSAKGHWCYAMLSIDYAAAIAVGRTLVGKYQRQLREAGILV